MRFVLLLAALICGLIATAVGFEIVTVDPGPADAVRVVGAWVAFGFTCYMGAQLVGERP